MNKEIKCVNCNETYSMQPSGDVILIRAVTSQLTEDLIAIANNLIEEIDKFSKKIFQRFKPMEIEIDLDKNEIRLEVDYLGREYNKQEYIGKFKTTFESKSIGYGNGTLKVSLKKLDSEANKIIFTQNEIEECYKFANGMKGNHNPNMIMEREDWEIFRDDFRGKLGEIAVKKYLMKYVKTAQIEGDIDFDVTPQGQWDITDMIINGNYVNVKSIKQGSNFLLVETKRYNEDGTYTYKNNDNTEVKVDHYILVRVTVQPDVSKSIFNTKLDDFLKKAWDSVNRKEVERLIYAEVLGVISHEEFWKQKKIAPRYMACEYGPLNDVVCGKQPVILTEKEREGRPKNKVLQQENFVIGCRSLKNLEEVF